MNQVRCDCCGKELSKGGLKYVVEIKAFADYDGYIEEYPGDVGEAVNDLLDVMDSMEAKDIEEDVFQEMIFILCKSCKNRFTRDPFESDDPSFDVLEVKGTVH